MCRIGIEFAGFANQTLFFKELIKLNIVMINLHGVDQFGLMILFIIIITRYEYHEGIYQ